LGESVRAGAYFELLQTANFDQAKIVILICLFNKGKSVTRFFKIFSIVIVTSILILIVIGVLAPKNTYFTKTQIIKSPVSVVWRKLVDVENYPTWQPSVKRVDLISDGILTEGNNLRFYMANYDSSVYHEAKVTKFEGDKTFTFVQTGNTLSPFLKDFKTSYSLKGLLDGTTEISVTVSYQTVGIITKIYNQTFLRGKLGSNSEQNLAMLRSNIEDM